MSMWSTSIHDYGMTSMEADPALATCSNPPAESCSDSGCPVHGDPASDEGDRYRDDHECDWPGGDCWCQ